MEKEEQMRQIHATPRPVSYHLMYERGLVLHHIVWTVWTQVELHMSTVSCCLQHTRCNYTYGYVNGLIYNLLLVSTTEDCSAHVQLSRLFDPLLIAGSGMDHRPWRGSWRFWGLQWRRLRIVLLLIDLNRDTEIHMIHTFFFADCERLMPSQAFGHCTSNRTLTFRDINLQGPFCSLQVLGEPPPSKFQWRRLQDFTVASISIMACLVEESLRLALLTRQTSCVWKPGVFSGFLWVSYPWKRRKNSEMGYGRPWNLFHQQWNINREFFKKASFFGAQGWLLWG